MFALLKWAGVLRVPLDMELNGLYIPKHNEFSYDISAWSDDFRSSLLDIETRDNNWVGQNYKAVCSQLEAIKAEASISMKQILILILFERY